LETFVSEIKKQNQEHSAKLDRKKQALRDNLKKRKAQIKDISADSEKDVKVRQKGLKLISPE